MENPVVARVALTIEDLECTKYIGGDGKAYDLIQFKKCDFHGSPGSPMVPVKFVSLALPQGYDAVDIHVTATNPVRLDGTFHLLPIQKPVPISEGKETEFTAPDSAIYSGNGVYPMEDAVFLGQGTLSGYAIAQVMVCPVKWNPATGNCTLSELEVTIVTVPSGNGPSVMRRSPIAEKHIRESVKGLVENPEQVPARAALELITPSSARVDVIEYLIITRSDLAPCFQPLADWKTKKGVPSEIVTTDWVYANYGQPTDDDATRIRECIRDYFQNKGLVYVLLGGDTASLDPPVPHRVVFAMSGNEGNKIPCDLYFADLDGTWDDDGDGVYGEPMGDNVDLYADVYLARASVDTVNQAARFVNKVLQYEGESSMPPLQTDYLTRMFFFASLVDANLDGKVLKENIDEKVIPQRFKPITKLYQSDGNLTPKAALAELNAGYSFINHFGHGIQYQIQAGTGYIMKGSIQGLENGPRYSIFFSTSCYSADFTWNGGDCVAEKFLNAPDGGGFYIGNSRVGWGSLPLYLGYTGRLDKEFYISIFDAVESDLPLGLVYADAKHKRVPIAKGDHFERYCQYQLNLLGDPEMPVWRDAPKSLAMNHPSILPVGTNAFQVNVYSGAAVAEGARVCLWKDDEVYEVQETDASGCVVFNPTPATGGIVLVTATLGDHFPCESSATVPGLSADPTILSESTGGTVDFHLTSGPDNASRSYVMVGGLSGTSPGILLPGGQATLPINWDYFSTIVVTLANTPLFFDFMGVVNDEGNATAQFNTQGPLPQGAAGLHLCFAFALNGPWNFVSNAIEIEIVP